MVDISFMNAAFARGEAAKAMEKAEQLSRKVDRMEAQSKGEPVPSLDLSDDEFSFLVEVLSDYSGGFFDENGPRIARRILAKIRKFRG